MQKSAAEKKTVQREPGAAVRGGEVAERERMLKWSNKPKIP